MRRVIFDLDGTLCTDEQGRYALARPFPARIAKVRDLYESGNWWIIIDTARGFGTGVDWMESTEIQLRQWGIPYHELRTGLKPSRHLYVGDEAVNAADYFAEESGHADRWPGEYFAERVGNDPRRQQAFYGEASFLRRHIGESLNLRTVCDVGCSTGEFLLASGWLRRATCMGLAPWEPKAYGMEISQHARRMAESNGVRFDRNIFTESDFFDCVIFRGTIQHLPHPFRYIERAYRALKPGGYVAFLATPNAGGLVYRLFQELPVSDDPRNYWMPSAKTLGNALRNFGFEVMATEYPYLNGGYARPVRDTLSFARRLLGIGRADFPWPGSMLNLIARKP